MHDIMNVKPSFALLLSLSPSLTLSLSRTLPSLSISVPPRHPLSLPPSHPHPLLLGLWACTSVGWRRRVAPGGRGCFTRRSALWRSTTPTSWTKPSASESFSVFVCVCFSLCEVVMQLQKSYRNYIFVLITYRNVNINWNKCKEYQQ